MISTPIANSLINYAQLLQTKKHGSIISVVGKTTVEIIEGSVAKFQNEQY